MFSKIWKKLSGKPDEEVQQQIDQLNSMVVSLYQKGQHEEAIKYTTKSANLTSQIKGKQHPDFALSLNNLAELYRSIGDYAAAEPLLKQAMKIYRVALGEQNPDFARSLSNLALLYQSMGDSAAAEPLSKQAMEIRRVVLGERHPDFATSLNNLAALYQSMGDYAGAEPLLKQAMKIYRVALGKRHPLFATSTHNLAALYQSMGDYVAAEELFKQAMEIRRIALGEQHPDLAGSLDDLAALYQSMGDYAAAESLHKQAMEICRVALGEQHPDFARSLSNLALLYQSMGDYAAAEPLSKQAMEICRVALGEQHPDFAGSLNNLAMLYDSIGDYAAAEPLSKQAMDIYRAVLGEQHPSFATSLNNLAGLYYSMGDYAAVEPLYKRAMEIRRAVLGEQHPSFAMSLNNLAALYCSTGDYAAAEPLLKQTMDIYRVVLGEQHPSFATSLSSLASLYDSVGDYAAAEPLYKRAMEIRRAVLGEQHPDFAMSLNNLASLFAATGREADAKKMMEQALAIDDRMIGQVFSISSEKQRTAYLKTVRVEFDLFLSLVSQYLSFSPEAVRSALSLVLRRKAIEAEALTTQRDAVLGGKYPEVAPKLREMTMLRAQAAQKTLAGPGKEGLQAHQQLLAEWNTRKERLEAEVARQVPEMNLEQKLRSIDHQVVAIAMPAGRTLIEFVRFVVYDFKAVPARDEPCWKPARYLAFVMPAGEPENVEMIDLGEAEPIDRMIATFRSSITGEEEDRSNRGLGRLPLAARRATGEDVGAQLREAIFTPLLKAIGNRKRLMISPDGDLTRLPFVVLPTDDGRRLIDEYQISYLGAGRDVVRFGFKSNREPARSLVAADPDFDFGGKAIATGAAAGSGRRSRDLKRDAMEAFDRLPGTRLEGENIAAMLDAELWMDSEALDARLKKCQSPRILHLATHGFFLEDQKRDPNEERSGFGAMSLEESGMERLVGARLENPLLRSGLVFAGVNTWLERGELMEDAEDGLLTAEDVSGLDLLDTELVVLSACETGLGEVHVGEGVFGLRRAFVLAGAKTLVMSLWKVPDEQTRELMEDFYHRILAGEPRADALRKAQLAMKAKYPEPLYWGAFICQGDPGPLA
jgi:CHAT domain-containing protein/tetratricopeptide (TPR) repeat protein